MASASPTIQELTDAEKERLAKSLKEGAAQGTRFFGPDTGVTGVDAGNSQVGTMGRVAVAPSADSMEVLAARKAQAEGGLDAAPLMQPTNDAKAAALARSAATGNRVLGTVAGPAAPQLDTLAQQHAQDLTNLQRLGTLDNMSTKTEGRAAYGQSLGAAEGFQRAGQVFNIQAKRREDYGRVSMPFAEAALQSGIHQDVVQGLLGQGSAELARTNLEGTKADWAKTKSAIEAAKPENNMSDATFDRDAWKDSPEGIARAKAYVAKETAAHGGNPERVQANGRYWTRYDSKPNTGDPDLKWFKKGAYWYVTDSSNNDDKVQS